MIKTIQKTTSFKMQFAALKGYLTDNIKTLIYKFYITTDVKKINTMKPRGEQLSCRGSNLLIYKSIS